MMRRPVYGFGLAFCLACLAGACVPLPALWLAAAFSACLFAVLTLRGRGARRGMALAWPAVTPALSLRARYWASWPEGQTPVKSLSW